MATERLSDLEQAAWAGFLRAHAELWGTMEKRLAGSGLSMTDYDVLVALESAGKDGMRMTELARRSAMTTGGFTRLADRLARQGLMERRRCPTDGRGFLAVLTADGRRALQGARTTHLDDVRELFLAHLSERDMAQLAGAWERILAAAPDETGD
jgi:DNA-binding MarR family transcriptional regulator